MVVQKQNQDRMKFRVRFAAVNGAVHKVRHARGEGVQEDVTVCDRGRGSSACDVTLILFLSCILNMKFKVMFNFLL